MVAPKRQFRERKERANPVEQVHVWQTPPGAAVDLMVVAHLHVYSAIHEHSLASLPNETGGFLLGHVRVDTPRQTWLVELNEVVPVDPVSQDPVHFSFTYREVDRVRNHREATGKALIGWYHTHPDMGIFLSETDLEKTHRVLFAEPFQIALVYDPVRQRAGYFFWEGPQLIDSSPAAWREFEICAGPDVPSPAKMAAEPPPSAPAVSPADQMPRGEHLE